MRPRVVYVCGGRSFSAANPGRKISEVVSCWRALGYDVAHVCGADVAGNGAQPEQYGHQDYYSKWYRRIAVLRPLLASVSQMRDIRHDGIVAAAVRGKAEGECIVWERSSPMHCASMRIAREKGLPYVLEWKDHLVPEGLSLLKPWALKVEQRKTWGADFIVVESEVLKAQLMQSGIEGGKIIVAHNAVVFEEFDIPAAQGGVFRKAHAISETDVVVGYVGSYAFYHDVPLLMRAARIVTKRSRNRVKFVLVGAGKQYEETHRAAEQLGLLPHSVQFVSPVPAPDVPLILKALDIAVLPDSTDIICPIKIPEYMAAGCAAIAPDYACNREVIDDGVNGLLFTPGSSESLAEAILSVTDDANLRRTIGEAGRETVRSRFSWRGTWGSALDQIAANCYGLRS